MDIDAVLGESRATREEAGAFLREFGLLEHLARYGEVQLFGSYRWDTMLAPDLDLNVSNPAADLDLALDALVTLAHTGNFYSYRLDDWVTFSLDGFPTGHYLGLKRSYNDRRWKVDIWFLQAPNAGSDWIEERMTEESRRVILAFKQLARTRNLPVKSNDIYRMALLEGVTDTDSFLEVVRSRSGS